MGFFSEEGESYAPGEARKELRRFLRPELLGRVDEIITFHPLDDRSMRAIAERELSRLRVRLEKHGVHAQFSPALTEELSRQGFHRSSGARELRRVLAEKLSDHLSDMLTGGELSSGVQLNCDFVDGEVTFSTRQETTV